MPGRWTNSSLPDTLQSAVILLYINAAFGLLFYRGVGLPLLLAGVAAGYGIANEKKWGYFLAVAVAVYDLVSMLLFWRFAGLFTLAFAALLVYLLLTPRSREHQRIWFR